MKVALGIPMIPPVVPSPASQVPFGEDGGSAVPENPGRMVYWPRSGRKTMSKNRSR